MAPAKDLRENRLRKSGGPASTGRMSQNHARARRAQAQIPGKPIGTSRDARPVPPVVLDRHPKSDPRKERSVWRTEVAAIVSASCRRIGLPQPAEIDIDKTSWHHGAPRAHPGPDGYPLMPRRPGGPNRRQNHVRLRFDQPALGPGLLGAGRYRGYGFCKPWFHNGGPSDVSFDPPRSLSSDRTERSRTFDRRSRWDKRMAAPLRPPPSRAC